MLILLASKVAPRCRVPLRRLIMLQQFSIEGSSVRVASYCEQSRYIAVRGSETQHLTRRRTGSTWFNEEL